MRKFLKVFGILLLSLVLILIALPFIFQGQIKDIVKRVINENVNAKVEFSDVNLSFIRDFPQANVSISDLHIINFEPFKDETFVTAKSISLSMSIPEVLKTASDGAITVNAITVNEALVTLKTDKHGNVNYDIAKTKDTESTPKDPSSNGFTFDIEDYQIKNSAFGYIDEGTKIAMHITELNHEGHGTFSAATSQLDTHTDANVSFTLDSVNYLSNNPIKLDALLGLDLENSKYTFKENKALVNQLPLEFDGYLQLVDEGQLMDITFENPESDFKNFLALIPEVYSKNIENVATTGDFKIKGMVKGLSSDQTIPKLDISILSKNASFKYPDLPKKVSQIFIDTNIKNETGLLEDTSIDIKTLNFKIDEDVFKSSATLKNITKNMLVNANLDGTLNLDNISKAYPVKLENKLSGILKAKVNTAFDMNAIETNAYKRIKNNGTASITDFVFSSEDIVNPIHISTANVMFSPGNITLNNFNAKTGDSDINANGSIDNLLGFLLSDTPLKGNFNVNSNLFKISDFMTDDTEDDVDNKTTDHTESLKIPAFLDCAIKADAKTVVYDNLKLQNVKGSLLIKEQQATLQNLSSNLFNGSLAISGNVSTKEKTPTFDLNLGAKDFDITQSFKNLELLQNIAPVAKLLTGKLNTNINLTGALTSTFSPDLSTISGSALAELLSAKFDKTQSNLISALERNLSFLNFNDINLKDLKTQLEFSEGKVAVKPFDFNYKDVEVEVSGVHSFGKDVDYNAVFNVPAKYLGSEVNRLIGSINDAEVNNITVPVTANISGPFNDPKVKTDVTNSVKNLTSQLVSIQKQKLLNNGKGKVKQLIGDVIGGNKSKTDSIKTQQSNTVKDVIGSIVKPKTETKDFTQTKTSTRETVKNVLGGLLGSKKKK